jgi:hypothetical protein
MSRVGLPPSHATAPVGQAALHARQSGSQTAKSISGLPRKRSGRTGAPSGYDIVR